MRAKEYLEINKSKILYYDIVKGAIDDLCLLRNKKSKTEEYFNKYLFSDARYLSQKEGFVLMEGEVDNSYAYDVRMTIFSDVCNDESFIFTFNIIVLQMNEYFEFIPINFCKVKEISCNTVSNIERICSLHKEDYTKRNLMSFLLDDDNCFFYEEKQNELNKEEVWWLNVFNEAYTIFDNMRLQLHKPFIAKLHITQYKNIDKDFENTVVDIVRYMVLGYDYNLSKKQKKEIIVLSKIINRHFSKVKRSTPQDRVNELENVINESAEVYARTIESKDEIIESRERTIEYLNQEIESLNLKFAQNENDSLNKGLTISQQNIFYYYMFNELDLNFDNSKNNLSLS